jgi:hypothetical protein
MTGRWMQKYSKPEAPLIDANEAIKLAWLGKLDKSVLIAPKSEYADLWGGLIWLCPDVAARDNIKMKDSINFALTTEEFFNICEAILEQGEKAKSIFDCLRLFNGSIETKENKGVA